MIDFDKIIDDYLHREVRPREGGRYYPSEIGNCIRKIWYSHKLPKEAAPDMLRIFHMGNMMHEIVVDILTSEKNKDIVLLQTEFPIKLVVDGFTISGRADDLVLVKMSGKSVLIEVKSVGPESLRYLNEAKGEHIMQLQLYMHATGVHNGMLLYIDRDRLRTRSFEIQYSEDGIEKIFSRFREIHNHMSTGTIPVAEARMKENMKWMCKMCQWRDECFTDTPDV